MANPHKEDRVSSLDGNDEVVLDTWTVDPKDGKKVMYSKLSTVEFCETHQFNKQHRCERCPYMFIGFRANMHIQTADGIFERKPGNELGSRLA